ncbi:hypothetical protein DBV15_06271 [Temnothorax longispinosus]|uniref:Uncharacterized protein n=1 Tax=Temnothorax longispinosus TaxID=300112 RepID=A0A4V6RGG6_9HYME|nr:hypothetical protein DBV15_06271 [Temnothorax longispinosus]
MTKDLGKLTFALNLFSTTFSFGMNSYLYLDPLEILNSDRYLTQHWHEHVSWYFETNKYGSKMACTGKMANPCSFDVSWRARLKEHRYRCQRLKPLQRGIPISIAIEAEWLLVKIRGLFPREKYDASKFGILELVASGPEGLTEGQAGRRAASISLHTPRRKSADTWSKKIIKTDVGKTSAMRTFTDSRYLTHRPAYTHKED